MDAEAYWKRIKLLCKEKRVTQETVAKAVGIPLSTFKNWMSKGIIPPFDYTVEFSRYFGMSMEYFVYGKETGIYN
jgi:transcriptional regulator with XRE-family HTH domain